MHAVVRKIFGRLHELNPETEEAKLAVSDPEGTENELRMKVQTAEAPTVDAPHSSVGNAAEEEVETPTPESKELPNGNVAEDGSSAEGIKRPVIAARSECL